MKKLYVVAALLSLLGLADALYLTIEHVTGQSVRCTIISGCSEVLSSPYAVVAGIPLAVIGAAAYFTVFSLAILALFGYRIAGTLLTPLVVAMFLRESVVDLPTGFCHSRVLPVLFIISLDHHNVISVGVY